MTDVIIARALHVLAVVVWIGGVSMATTVVLPAVRRGQLGSDRLSSFEAIERRFIWQARTAVAIVGFSGFYMSARLHLWDRFHHAGFWWMHAMVLVWTLFVLLLFVAEPFILHRHLRGWAERSPERAFAWLHRVHWLLLVLSLITVFGAVAGSRGWPVF